MAHKIYGQNVMIISSGEQPQLYAPTVTINKSIVTIKNSTSNGDFVTAYKVYTEYGYVATVTETTVDLSTLITEGGTYTITVKCTGTNFEDSIASNAVSWTYTQLATPQNVTADGTTVSWDEVENATSYEIFADGVSIGTVGQSQEEQYITFTGESSDFTLKATYKEWDGTVEYSTDKTTWTTWDGTAISSSNKKLYLRGSGNTTFCTSNGAKFVLSARAACSGNLNTLLEYSNLPTTLNENCYKNMFYGCTNLTTAPSLPATTLADNCYKGMFYGCTGLTLAPHLPASTLSVGCYYEMFKECTNLTQAPELPATTLADDCYYHMFHSCINLTKAPELPATTLAYRCYAGMFYGCEGLTSAPALPATTLTVYCYSTMFNGCIRLTTPPELHATTLAGRCYSYMFNNCTALTKAPELPATTLAMYCYERMLSGCSVLKISATQSSEYPTPWKIPSSGTIPDNPIPSGWNTDMLVSTGGTFTSDPSINTTYYGAWGDETTVDPLAGTWVFNDSLNISADIMWNVNYTTNSTEYTTLRISLQSSPIGQEPCMGTSSSTVEFYNMGAWQNPAYKTIVITSKLSEVTNGDTLLAWLQANATKQ